MATESLTVFTCGAPQDHKCDSDGAPVVILANGTTMPENEWKEKNPDSWKGLSGGSATCSQCGLSSYELSFWRDW